MPASETLQLKYSYLYYLIIIYQGLVLNYAAKIVKTKPLPLHLTQSPG